MPGEVARGPQYEAHQADKEKGGERHNPVNHFALGDEVHEITGHQKCFSASDEESDANIQRSMSKRNVGRCHGDDSAKQKGVKDEQVTADMVAEVVG